MKVAAFDIEIAKEIPEGETDWKRFRPLGITCAAIATPRGVWTYAAEKDGEYLPKMSILQITELLADLVMLAKRGYNILSWNGLGFDFDILAEESGLHIPCADLALNHHVDMMFHFFCDKGYPVGLDAVSKGLGLPGKPEGIDGAKAPALWKTDPERVLDYVRSDAKQTLEVYRRSQVYDGEVMVAWTARSGRPNTWRAERWLSVKEAMTLPEPDTSWMSDPMTRGQFYGWIPEGMTEGKDYTAIKRDQLFDITGLVQHDPDGGNDEL